MNIEFDYYKFPKQKKIKNDVKIDLSGLEVKSDATILEKDDNNEISEVELAEIVDENINYVYTGATTSNGTTFTYYPKDSNGNWLYDQSGKIIQYYRLIGENVHEVDLIDFSQTNNPNTLNLYDNAVANIIPRHLRFANNTSPIIEKGIFAALGLFPSNKFNINEGEDRVNRNKVPCKYDLDISDIKYKGCLSRKSFYNALNKLTERLLENGIEVVTKEYNADESKNGTDINETGIMPYDNFYISRSKAPSFIKKKMNDGGMDVLSYNDITPFNLSVKEVFKSYYTSSDELNELFIEELRILFKAINASVLVNSFVDDSDIGILKKPIIALDSSYDSITAVFNDESVSIVDGGEFNYNDTTYYRTMWAYYTDNDINYIISKDGNPLHQFEYVLPDDADINNIIDILPKIKQQINRASAVIATSFVALGIGAAPMALAIESINDAKESLSALNRIIKQIRWYQHYTNESIFTDKQFIRDGDSESAHMGPIPDSYFKYDKRLCRLLVPVYMGSARKKVKRKNIFGKKKSVYIRVDLGVRWVEINFVDTKNYKKYRKNEKILGKNNKCYIPVSSLVANGNTVSVVLSKELPINIMNIVPLPKNVAFTLYKSQNKLLNGTFTGTIIDSTHIKFIVDNASFASYTSTTGILNNIILPFETTKEPDEPRNITINYSMPHLPYDSELRKKVFSEYGPFDQGKYANKNRNGDYTLDLGGNIVLNDDIEGWEIFHKSSKSIEDLRGGIDIYNKVQFLIQILINEFGKNRVHLIETMRSYEDQEKIQLGGSVSGFLSWHNYGLAAKIRIISSDLITPILDGSDDMMKLLDIAEAFIEGCKLGDYGTPINVVWCGQLVTCPDLFVWEFLPIGVDHKDIVKFRDSAYSQYDPVVANSYVNVSKKGYIVDTSTYLDSTTPYILKGSNSLTNGMKIHNDIYVDPKKITNFSIPSNLILKDIKEFLMLVQSKMNANGTELMGRKQVAEWKANNPKSFNQLVVFNSLIGNYSASRGLLSGDYIDKFSNIIDRYYTSDPIKFVQLYLGDFYYDIKISIDDFSDSSFITLYDGKLTTIVLDARSTHKEGNGNTFGQKQIDFNSVEFGQYQNGVFINESNAKIITIKTDIAVITGYDDNGNPLSGDTRLIHSLIADQLYEEFKQILNNFNNLKIKFMYDSFYNSPNYKQLDVLENEFGVIQTQTLLPFSQLRDMYTRISINNKKTDTNGTVKGAGSNIEDMTPDDITSLNESVYEKLVSTSQQVGARKALLTREKPTIEAIQVDNKIEKTIQLLNKNRIPKVTDIL